MAMWWCGALQTLASKRIFFRSSEVKQTFILHSTSNNQNTYKRTLLFFFFNPRENSSWDVKLALDYKDLQRRIITSVVDSCSAGLQMLDHL